MVFSILLLSVVALQDGQTKYYPFDLNQNPVITEEQLESITFGQIEDPFDDLEDSQFLPSIDLREYGLVSYIQDQTHGCQSCYAHAAISMIEAAYLRSQLHISQSKELSQLWKFNYSNAKISTSFLMTNSISQSEYCAYGSGQGVIFEIAKQYAGYELESVYPKNFGLYQSMFYRGEELPMKTPRQLRYFPFKLLNVNGYQLTKPKNSQLQAQNDDSIATRFEKELLRIYASQNTGIYIKSPAVMSSRANENTSVLFVTIYRDANKPYGPDIVRKIKSYLSRGITMMVGLNSGGPQAPHYYVYHGDENLVLKCKTYIPHHLVQIIGYGKHRGKDVLVYKNSWGLDWGAFGSFFVEIGTNAACIEQDVIALIPAGYDPEDPNNAFLQPTQHIRGGKYARYLLDMDPGDVRTEIPTDSWFADNFMTLIRNQSIDMVLILFFSLLGLATVLGYLVIDGGIMLAVYFTESKKMKKISNWKKQFRKQLQERDMYYKIDNKVNEEPETPSEMANSENFIDEDDYRPQYQINNM